MVHGLAGGCGTVSATDQFGCRLDQVIEPPGVHGIVLGLEEISGRGGDQYVASVS
jgi:hypothetical protein